MDLGKILESGTHIATINKKTTNKRAKCLLVQKLEQSYQLGERVKKRKRGSITGVEEEERW